MTIRYSVVDFLQQNNFILKLKCKLEFLFQILIA